MIPLNDTLDAVFFGCLLFGVLFTLVSLLLGVADLGFDAGADSFALDSWLLNVSAILAFIAWFGGIGLLSHEALGLPGLASIAVAVAGGLVGGYVVGKGIKRLSNAGEVLNPDAYEMPGTIARVTSSIRSGGTGEIVYEQEGSRQVSAARAENGQAIDRGTEVVVLRYESGIATVEAWDRLMSERALSDRRDATTIQAHEPALMTSGDRHGNH
jgi:membrane protein implicated in regulation of membrane protease activity